MEKAQGHEKQRRYDLARQAFQRAIDEAPNTNAQPWPHAYPGTTDTDHSNMFQNTVINCPTFDYALWKSIAQSGSKNHFY